MFELKSGWLFYGLDGVLYCARWNHPTDVTQDTGNPWLGWEVFEVRIEWWHSVYEEE